MSFPRAKLNNIVWIRITSVINKIINNVSKPAAEAFSLSFVMSCILFFYLFIPFLLSNSCEVKVYSLVFCYYTAKDVALDVTLPGGHPGEGAQGARVWPRGALTSEVGEVWWGLGGWGHHLHAHSDVLPGLVGGGGNPGNQALATSHIFLKCKWEWRGTMYVNTFMSTLWYHEGIHMTWSFPRNCRA